MKVGIFAKKIDKEFIRNLEDLFDSLNIINADVWLHPDLLHIVNNILTLIIHLKCYCVFLCSHIALLKLSSFVQWCQTGSCFIVPVYFHTSTNKIFMYHMFAGTYFYCVHIFIVSQSVCVFRMHHFNVVFKIVPRGHVPRSTVY